MSMKKITGENFDALVMQAQGKVLLDFWAAWCGPCQMIAPFVEAVAEESPDLLVGKVDVDTDPELAKRFGIVSIPTLVLVKDGREAARIMGYRPKADILNKLGL